ncbi:MAG: helix-turn-helix domain-containing protein, partial [Actinomycetota bacterium]
MDFGKVLRESRRKAGLSQRQLARLSGVAQPAIARLESGRAVPRVDLLDRLL